ncbi:zinc knuckle, partial [Ostertagia ostertagi]
MSQRVQCFVLQLKSTSKLVLETLDTFVSMIDSLLDSIDEQQMAQIQEYIERAQSALERAQKVAIQLECRRTSARDHMVMPPNQNAASIAGTATSPNAHMGTFVYSSPNIRAREQGKKMSSPYNAAKGPVTCIFCNSSGHKSLDCQKYSTIEKRKTALREKNRCFNCSLPGHFTQDCMRYGCKACNGSKHHYTLCPQRGHHERPAQARFVTPTSSAPLKGTKTSRGPQKEERRQQQLKSPKVQAHAVETNIDLTFPPEPSDDSENSIGTVLSTINSNSVPTEKSDQTVLTEKSDQIAEHGNVLLLTGVAKVKDTHRDQWKEVEVLLDTGADQSFISNELARELGINGECQTKLTVYTFGTDIPKQTICEWTNLDIWDQQGNKHSLRLLTTPILTTQQKR